MTLDMSEWLPSEGVAVDDMPAEPPEPALKYLFLSARVTTRVYDDFPVTNRSRNIG
jgi:hypothetical protein